MSFLTTQPFRRACAEWHDPCGRRLRHNGKLALLGRLVIWCAAKGHLLLFVGRKNMIKKWLEFGVTCKKNGKITSQTYPESGHANFPWGPHPRSNMIEGPWTSAWNYIYIGTAMHPIFLQLPAFTKLQTLTAKCALINLALRRSAERQAKGFQLQNDLETGFVRTSDGECPQATASEHSQA